MPNSDSANTRQRAEGRIRLAMQRLAAEYPFHVQILEQFVVLARTSVGTMGVMAAEDAVVLFHNPAFVLALPLAELSGVLLHEVHHVLFRHIVTDPADYPDSWARTIAQEVTVNEFVKEPLPEGVILLEMFPMLPAMESTAARYQRLKGEQDLRRKFPLADSVVGHHGGQIGAIDNHDVWHESNVARRKAAAALRALIQDAVIEVGHRQVPPGLRRAVGQWMGSDQLALWGANKGHLDWRRLLRRHIGQVLTVRPSYTRPPRRHPELVGIAPGRQRRRDRAKVLSVVDTSGSICREELDAISAELRRMNERFSVTVVECDAEIQTVYPYKPLRYVSGRGGTDFRPPLARAFLQKHRPDVVVYFTDGAGPAPERRPSVPVVWCLVGGGEPPVTWGRVVRIKDTVQQPAT